MAVFKEVGASHTDATLSAVVQFLTKNKVFKHLIVASTTGATGLKVTRLFSGLGIKIVVVGHSHHHGEDKIQQWSKEHPDEPAKMPLWKNQAMIKEIQKSGAEVYTGTTVFEGLEKAVRKQTGYSQGKLIADTLRLFGQGTKVCAEIAVSAVDAGLVPDGEYVICIAGTGFGADTAAVVQTAPSERFFDLKFCYFITKPKC